MIIIGDQVCENFVLKAVLTLSSGMFAYSCWWTPERECNHFSNIEDYFNFFQFQKTILVITLPHFSPGQGKWPGWWTSTWWAFIFPENFVLKIGLFNNFSIYQLINFPARKIYHLHRSPERFFNGYRCCQFYMARCHIEEHGNHYQSHSHSDPWFGFS